MNTQNVWIKRSEREPTEEDLPIVMGGYMCGSGKAWDIALYTCLPPKSHWSGYWRSIKADPPPRELTQRERDEQWVDSNSWPQLTRAGAMLQAIYAERREVAKLLTEYFGGDCWRDENKVPDMRDIAARLAEQGAK